MKIFPALVAANKKLAERRSTEDGKLHLLVLYREDRYRASDLAKRLGELASVGGYPFQVDLAPVSELPAYREQPPAGVLVAEWMPDELSRVIRFGIETHTVTFSPFRGDVPQGILGGLFVSNRVLPSVNMSTLRASQIPLKPFFLEVAKRYE